MKIVLLFLVNIMFFNENIQNYLVYGQRTKWTKNKFVRYVLSNISLFIIYYFFDFVNNYWN